MAYDVIGHCYYLEDGSEEDNTFEHNLGAHVHFLSPTPNALAPYGAEAKYYTQQFLADVQQTAVLTLPADVTASPFYITNPSNRFIGNAASGGWSGYAFPALPTPTEGSRAGGIVPKDRPLTKFDGNTAHSTGYWWSNGGGVYVGGKLWHPSASNTLRYNGGRINGFDKPNPPKPHLFTNTKVALSSVGMLHWGTTCKIDGAELVDFKLMAKVFGFAILTNIEATCTTGNVAASTKVAHTEAESDRRRIGGAITGFQWYDTGQSHIVDDVKFVNCNDAGKNAGAPDMHFVWELLSHSDLHVPEAMQATRRITYDPPINSASRTKLIGFSRFDRETVSARYNNWFDTDGTTSGAGAPTLLGSTVGSSGWWRLDSKCEAQNDWNLWICDATKPRRRAGSIFLTHNPGLHATIGKGSICGNDWIAKVPCPAVGWANHLGRPASDRIPITANPELTGTNRDPNKTPHNTHVYYIMHTGPPGQIKCATLKSASH